MRALLTPTAANPVPSKAAWAYVTLLTRDGPVLDVIDQVGSAKFKNVLPAVAVDLSGDSPANGSPSPCISLPGAGAGVGAAVGSATDDGLVTVNISSVEATVGGNVLLTDGSCFENPGCKAGSRG